MAIHRFFHPQGLFFSAAILSAALLAFAPAAKAQTGQGIKLPAAKADGPVSVEKALASRRTHRSFFNSSLTLAQLGQLLWAAYGITAPPSYKTAPSAGALYPLDIYAAVGEGCVHGLRAGVYRYSPGRHALESMAAGDRRMKLARASLGQTWMARAPVMLAITAQYSRSTVKYGRRGIIYTHIEAGAVGQNIFLQAEAMGLKAGIVGAFDNRKVLAILSAPQGHIPLLLMPVGQGGP